jgi:hypothetical protein
MGSKGISGSGIGNKSHAKPWIAFQGKAQRACASGAYVRM